VDEKMISFFGIFPVVFRSLLKNSLDVAVHEVHSGREKQLVIISFSESFKGLLVKQSVKIGLNS
jgi:hypothetical protein